MKGKNVCTTGKRRGKKQTQKNPQIKISERGVKKRLEKKTEHNIDLFDENEAHAHSNKLSVQVKTNSMELRNSDKISIMIMLSLLLRFMLPKISSCDLSAILLMEWNNSSISG